MPLVLLGAHAPPKPPMYVIRNSEGGTPISYFIGIHYPFGTPARIMNSRN